MWLEKINAFYFSRLIIGPKGYPCFAGNTGGDSNACSTFLLPQTLYKVLEILLWWADPSQQPNTHPAAYSLPSLTRQGKKRRKARGLVHLDNNSLTGKAKAVVISQAKYGISSLLHISRQMSSQFPASRASAHVMLVWDDKLHHHKCLSSSCPEVFFLRVPLHGMEYFLVALSLLSGSAMLSPLSILPFPRPTHFWMCVGWVETLMLFKYCSLVAKALGCH